MNLETFILNDFFEMLNDIGAEYCVMNNYENMPEVIPSDVDFAVSLKVFGTLDSLVIKLADKHNVRITQKIWHGYNKCAFILSPVDINSYFFLQLDFFVDFSGKGFPNLFPNSDMQYGKKRYKNFYIPSTEVEVPFLLQRRIFKGDIKESHIKTLASLYAQNPEGVDKNIKTIFGNEIGNSLINFIRSKKIEVFHKNYLVYRKKLHKISASNTNVIYRIRYTAWQAIRAVYRLYYPTGLSIAFVGNDTPLKNELIKQFDSIVSGSFHGLVIISPKNTTEYIKGAVIKGYWGKVTKKKTIFNLNTKYTDWKKQLSKSWLKTIFPMPDVVIYLNTIEKVDVAGEYTLSKKKDIGTILNKITSQALNTQANKTKKHLMNKISPTGKCVSF